MLASSAEAASADCNLFGLDRDGLARFLERYGVPAFHARQVYRWLYQRRRFDPAEWTDLARSLRERIAVDARVDPGTFDGRAEAADGTIKYRVALSRGGAAECVFMVQSGRVTLCLSSQVGCALGCDFCLTGKMGFVRHLEPGEIVGQVARILEDRGLEDERFNIVFMGMGEPLHNYAGTVAAIRLLTDPEGFGMSRRRITVSTAGLAPAIEKLADEAVLPRLAVSLNATTDAVRDRLMPINRKYPIERLLAACRHYAQRSGQRFTLEYVLLEGINDTDADRRRLSRLLTGLPAKLNLIPFNAVPGWLDYGPPHAGRVEAFRDALLSDGTPASIRWSRGIEARAACGQLALLPDTPDSESPAARRTS